jgi:hypothetical protein
MTDKLSKEIIEVENELMLSLYSCLQQLEYKVFLRKKDRQLIKDNIDSFDKFNKLKKIVETELP